MKKLILVLVVSLMGLAPAFAETSTSTVSADEKRTTAQDEVTTSGVDAPYWVTEGSGFCSTGQVMCNSGRIIGCNAQGQRVRCETMTGNMAWIRCSARTGVTNSFFQDQCP